MSKYNNYEQILYEWICQFVDKDKYEQPLAYRNTAPTLEEIQDFGEKVYCVYTVFQGGFGQQTSQPITLYCYGSQRKLFEKIQLLSQELLNGATVVSGNNIKVKFTSGSPFIQDKADANENIKGYYVNIIATVYKV